jgi:hypothetical protein
VEWEVAGSLKFCGKNVFFVDFFISTALVIYTIYTHYLHLCDEKIDEDRSMILPFFVDVFYDR